MKRNAIAGAIFAGIVIAVGAMAPGASAGIDTPRVLVGNVNGACAVSSGADEITITGNPGDSFRVFNLGCGPVTTPSTGNLTGPGSIPQFGSATYTLGSSVGSGTLVINPDRTVTTVPFVIRVNIVSTPITTPRPVMHDYLQQVGLPRSGSCSDVAHDAGHFDGFPYGGWSASWAQWINNGRGGPICTREIYFDANRAEWRYVGQR